MKKFSTYFSDDGRAEADVYANSLIGLRVVCRLDGRVVAEINSFETIDDAENFAEDFVLKKNKNKEDEYVNDGQPPVLYFIAEPNERNSQPGMA